MSEGQRLQEFPGTLLDTVSQAVSIESSSNNSDRFFNGKTGIFAVTPHGPVSVQPNDTGFDYQAIFKPKNGIEIPLQVSMLGEVNRMWMTGTVDMQFTSLPFLNNMIEFSGFTDAMKNLGTRTRIAEGLNNVCIKPIRYGNKRSMFMSGIDIRALVQTLDNLLLNVAQGVNSVVTIENFTRFLFNYPDGKPFYADISHDPVDVGFMCETVVGNYYDSLCEAVKKIRPNRFIRKT